MRVVITGANRGIGLGLADKFAMMGHEVIATCRHPDGARELWEVESEAKKRLTIHQMDVTDTESVNRLSKVLAGETIDILINNAGMATEYGAGLQRLTEEAMRQCFETNTLGPLRTIKAFLPNLLRAQAPIVANISTKVASIDDNRSGFAYAYRTSKTALNMLNKCISIEFPEVCCALLHPGWVKTSMGGNQAPTDVLESVSGLYEVITNLSLKDSGGFFDFRGEPIPW